MTQSPGSGHPGELGQSGCVGHLLPGGDLGFSLERQLSHMRAQLWVKPCSFPFLGKRRGKELKLILVHQAPGTPPCPHWESVLALEEP